MPTELLEQALALLQRETNMEAPAAAREQLLRFTALVRKWNRLLNLVSDGDLPALEDKHLTDALSLIPYIPHGPTQDTRILDIGSGGGFPILPIACLLPHASYTLVERSSRKVGFLHRAVAALALSRVEIVHGSFPESMDKITADVVTSRAVERPRQVVPALLNRLPGKCVYLCQTDISTLRIPGMFHVERVQDTWRQAGLRRAELTLISRIPPQ